MKGERKVITTEGKIYDKNGEIIDIEDTSAFCVYRKKNAVLSIIRDITPKKQVIQLKEDMRKNEEMLIESMKYNQYVTELFANISHELKTPLNIIFSSTQLLSLYNDSIDPKVINKRKEYLQSVKYNCYRLNRLIDNILDTSKLDAGFINLNLKNANIVEEVENITMSIIPYAESKGIEITFDTDEEEIIMAFDADKIERIMLNLLSNALKFTNEGGHIYVNICNEEGFVNISVKDTGIGIPEDMKALIFERFMQVDKTFRRNNEGTGIGLALVKSFTELHKGRVTLESELHKGSEITITLPITLVDVNDDESEIKGSILDKVDLELSDIYTRRN